jgi:hypothetical protein
VVKISAGNVEQVTAESPTDPAESAPAMAVAAGPAGLLLTFVAGRRLVRWPPPGPTRGTNCALGLSAGLFMTGLLAAVIAARDAPDPSIGPNHRALWLFGAIYVSAAAFMTWIAVDVARSGRTPAA